MNCWKWPNARDWIGIGTFGLSVMVLWMMKDPVLREDEFFQTIATAIILTGFLGGPVSWAYAATKGGGEAQESSQRIAEKAAEAAVISATEPQKVIVDNPEENPVLVEETKR
jgi:hypothetical protein